MATLRHRSLQTRITAQTGQAMIEFAVAAVLLMVLVFGLIDFGRALNFMQVMSGLSRQGSNLASRGDTLQEAAQGVISGEAPLDLTDNGEVIVTSVTNLNGSNMITGQQTQGALTLPSQVGQGVGTAATGALAGSLPMLQSGRTVFVTEVYYTFQPITPIGNITHLVLPSTLYEAAYF
jgi:Flp pilus assembly protein TadG